MHLFRLAAAGSLIPLYKAQPETIETDFENFVSFVDSVVGAFLPWLLRGLETLSEYGSDETRKIDWSAMAKDVEKSLSARGGDTTLNDALTPLE